MKRQQRLAFGGICTNTVFDRRNLVTIRNMARPYEEEPAAWPEMPKEREAFDELVRTIVQCRSEGKPVIWSMGAHVIKNGMSRYVIEMVRHGILTHVSGNGATSIHDFELAFLGETSEDVARAIEDGSFGMWEETGRYMNEAIQQGAADGLGYGESLYRYLSRYPERFPHYDDCVFVQCQRAGIPYTCHISIGTDIIHQHPIVDFAALGGTSGRDFAMMCQSVAELAHGGVFLNFGSAISGPEIFLKAITLGRNAGLPMAGITAANFDIVPVYADEAPPPDVPEFYYRPRRNFVDRLGQIGGKGLLFHGLHQATIPQLFQRVLARKRELGFAFPPYERKEAPARARQLYPIAQRRAAIVAQEPDGLHSGPGRMASPFSGGELGSATNPDHQGEPRRATNPDHQGEPRRATNPDHLGEPGSADASPGVQLQGGVRQGLGLPGVPWSGASEPAFQLLLDRLREARAGGKHAIASLGGNVVGSGVSPDLVTLIQQGFITHLALTGAAAFQDVELAAFGQTEELDGDGLASGKLGMWQEPGAIIHQALREGYGRGLGYGESLMEHMRRNPGSYPYRQYSLLHACSEQGIPSTVHITIGTDNIQQHPDADFAIQGGASGVDFQVFAATVTGLEGGVFMNFGSTVTGPEVFLKALSIARNLQYTVNRITTANFDIVRLGDYHRKVGYEDWDYYYRPRKNIIHRPTSLGGDGFHFEGLHQQTIPAIRMALVARGKEEEQ